MNAKVKEFLNNHVRPIVNAPDRRYKALGEEAVHLLYEQIMEENEMLHRRISSLEDTIKLVVNQSQLAMSEVRNIKKAIDQRPSSLRTHEAAAAAAAAEAEGDAGGSEEVDLKGE